MIDLVQFTFSRFADARPKPFPITAVREDLFSFRHSLASRALTKRHLDLHSTDEAKAETQTLSIAESPRQVNKWRPRAHILSSNGRVAIAADCRSASFGMRWCNSILEDTLSQSRVQALRDGLDPVCWQPGRADTRQQHSDNRAKSSEVCPSTGQDNALPQPTDKSQDPRGTAQTASRTKIRHSLTP